MGAIGNERVSSTLGYKVLKGNFNETTRNLPQRIVVLAEASTANQVGLDISGVELTSAQAAGIKYGYGSPIYSIMRILHPLQGAGVGGIPVQVYAQAEAGGAVAKVMTVTPVGVATKGGRHTLVISGREGLDGSFYDIEIATGDNVAIITGKIADVINSVLGCPVTATTDLTVTTATAKWKGLTSQEIEITVNLNGTDLGITYTVAETAAGSGTPSINTALNQFGEDWNTTVINSYGMETNTLAFLEAFNGKPDPISPTGRYVGEIFKPFIALSGTKVDNPTGFTAFRKEEVTIAICPAPFSSGSVAEAAANMCRLYARTAQDTPHLDVLGQYYPDMPTPSVIGSMENYNSRDEYVKKGCSTVELSNGKYKVVDFVTTYHPDGEIPPQFRYCRNLNIDFNIAFGKKLINAINVLGHVIANDDDIVTVGNVIKPKMLAALLDSYADELVRRGLIVDAAFTQESIVVTINAVNPDRLDDESSYKRSGVGRIATSVVEAGFNFGGI